MVRVSDETIVEDAGVTVTKAFDRDGFPVPAVTFRVESDRSDPVAVRIVDAIPDDFGIEQIGFHPEYGSEHWTATGEGVVRFERTVDSGEAFTTVYGVKMGDDGQAAPFLGAPTLEVDPDAIDESAIEDVVPKESSDVVRELAGGERESVPGLDEEPSQSTGDDVTADDSSETAGDTTDQADSIGAVADDDAVIIGENDGAQEETTDAEYEDESGDSSKRPDQAPPVDDEDILEASAGTTQDVPDGDTAESDPVESDPLDTESSTAATDQQADEVAELAEQAEEASTVTPDEPADEVPADRAAADLTEPESAMNDEFEETTPAAEQETESATTETDAVLATADGDGGLAAALAEEIRDGTVDDDDLDAIREAVGEPTTSDGVRVDHLQARLSDLEAYTDALETFLNENGGAQDVLDDLKETVESVGEDVETLASRVDSAQGEREALRERVNTLADEMDAIDDVADRIDRIAGDLDALDERVEDGEQARLEVDSLEDELADLEDEIDELEEEIGEFKEWRSQLSDLFN